VESLAFSPDGKTLAVDTIGNTVALWDVTARRWRAVPQPVCLSSPLVYTGIAYSPDGRMFAFDSFTGVALWDTRSGRVTARLPTRGDATALAFSPDGKLLAEGTGFGATSGPSPGVNLWTVATGQKTGQIGPLPSAVRSLAVSPDGGTLAVVSQDTSVRLWSVASQQLDATLSGHTSQVNDVAFTPDGRTLITTSADGTARSWDLNPGDEVRALCAALRGPAFTAQWRQLTPSPGPNPCPGA
jgi:WD40 repeat protein